MTDRIDQPEGLQEKLDIIKNLPIDFRDKIFMVLVLLGEKNGEEFWISYDNKTKSVVDSIKTQLIDIGFEPVLGAEITGQFASPEDIENGQVARNIYYSYSLDTAKRIHDIFERRGRQTPDEDLELGKIFCFPETAIQTYTYNPENTIGFDDLPEDVQAEDYSLLLQFALSKDNWKEEIKKVKQMADKLQKYVPDLWKQYVEAKRKRNIERRKNFELYGTQ